MVNVIDENDNVPVFSRETYNFNLRENPTIDEEVGTIATTDRDVGVNAEVSYAVDDGRFQIDEGGKSSICFKCFKFKILTLYLCTFLYVLCRCYYSS